jgi:di/tricarboxylate transporter
VVVFQGNLSVMPETLGELGCLPLAERNIRLGYGTRRWVTVTLLAATMVVTALNLVPVQIAFFTLAAAVVLIRSISLKEAYDAVDWPILVMLAALIPVSDAVRTTGGADLIASGLASVAHALPPAGALALILIVAMAVTPFLNNAATVLIMAPIAAGFAQGLGFNSDPFLMAVAIGAACDFLTPIGHQCNTRHGPRRVPVRRLLALGAAVVDPRGRGLGVSYPRSLAVEARNWALGNRE